MDGLDHAAPARRARGRFAPGQSGNPAGKQPGTRNRATILRELLVDGDVERAVTVLREQLQAGNGVAARFVLDRLFPKPRDRDIDLGLPPLEAGTTLVQMFDRVLSLMAAGEITIDEASRIARLITERREQVAFASGAAARGAAAAKRLAEADASPASDLHRAGDRASGPEAPVASPRPLNRHERRRATAVARAVRVGAATAPPLTVVA
jgi:hypothetical protein